MRVSGLEATNNDLTAKFEIQKGVHARAMEDAKDTFQKLLRSRLQEEHEQWEQKRREEERTRQSEPRRETERAKLKLDTRLPPKDSFSDRTGSAMANSPSALDLIPNGGAPAQVIDRLHGTVKQLEGQVAGLQTQLQMASRTRDELADELVRMTGENESLKQQIARVERLENDLTELHTRLVFCRCGGARYGQSEGSLRGLGPRYNASLDLLGERTEEVDELRQDLLDVKVCVSCGIRSAFSHEASVSVDCLQGAGGRTRGTVGAAAGGSGAGLE